MNIVHEILGEKYLLIKAPLFADNKKEVERRCRELESFDCIYQGFDIKRSLLFKSYIVLYVLVPERNIVAFNKKFF